MRARALPVAALALIVLVPASPARAKTFDVTERGDPAPNGCKPHDCSLREAVRAANARSGADTVVLPKHKAYNLHIPDIGDSEVVARRGDLDVTGALTIKHPGKGRATIDANGIDRVIQVGSSAPMAVRRIRIVGGDDPVDEGGAGGGILTDSSLRLIHSAVEHNSTGTSNNEAGGVMARAGTLRLISSAISFNTSSSSGAASIGDRLVMRRSRMIGNDGGDGVGGAMYVYGGRGSVIDRSTIAGNRAEDDGGGVYYSASGTVGRVTASTFSANRSTEGLGGGIFARNGTLRLTNSTVSGNRAFGAGGGIYGFSPTHLNAVTVVRNVTNPTNTSGYVGGGLAGNDSSVFTVKNSLIALNRLGSGGPSDCNADAGDGSFDSGGHNLLSNDISCVGFDAAGDRVRANPRLGVLAANGGPTKTVALLKHSPAIGKGSKQSSPRRDQRGRKRDPKPDIGAFERL